VNSLSPQYKAIFSGRLSAEPAKAVAKFTGEILLAVFEVWQAGNAAGCTRKSCHQPPVMFILAR
jgi:hypothetical protein